jgi:hypothetical protein
VIAIEPPPLLTVPEWHSAQFVSCGKPPRDGAPEREANGLDENAPAGEVFNSISMNSAQKAPMIESLNNTLPISISPDALVQLF